MKRFLPILLLLPFFTGCSQKENAEDFITSIIISQVKATHPYSSETGYFTFEIQNPRTGVSLTAKSSETWIKDIKIKQDTVSYTVSENNSGADRTGTITLNYGNYATKNFSIKQSYTASVIVTTPATQQVDYTGGSFSFDYSVSNPREGASVAVTSKSDWITDVTISGSTVSYKVPENNSGAARTGAIRLSYGSYATKDYSVAQSYTASMIVTTPATQQVDYTGGSFSFDYSVSNPREGATVTVTSKSDWITDVTISASTVSYKVGENNSGVARVGKICLTYGNYATKDFTPNQLGLPVQSLTLNKSTLALLSGTSETLIATVEPADAPLQWASNKTTVATVDQTGKVSAIGNGTVTITVSAENGKSESCTITVTTAVTGILLNKTSLILIKGAQEQLTTTVSPSTASDKSVTWSSTNTGIATVDQSGNVIAMSKGSASVIVAANDGSGKSASCNVGVYDAINLSADETANCYIVSSAGDYCFVTTKGNSSTSVGTVSSVAVLWESYGTSTTPSVGSIINNVSYSDNAIYFSTPATLKNGNAVIAAMDASGNILWSWHIWVCSGYNPANSAQTYYNSAGKMMDRNLGATSATPGDVGALGLMYQWGRKDPFLGSSNISSNTKAASTLSWPSAVASNSSNGTIAYAVAHPTTFIQYNNHNNDWYYCGYYSTEDKRWESTKTIYDPCPPGWKVPKGGSKGVWSTAYGSSSEFKCENDETNKGINFSSKFGASSTIWYPAAGYLLKNEKGKLASVGDYCRWWSCTPGVGCNAHTLLLVVGGGGYVNPSTSQERAYGLSVRCVQE